MLEMEGEAGSKAGCLKKGGGGGGGQEPPHKLWYI